MANMKLQSRNVHCAGKLEKSGEEEWNDSHQTRANWQSRWGKSLIEVGCTLQLTLYKGPTHIRNIRLTNYPLQSPSMEFSITAAALFLEEITAISLHLRSVISVIPSFGKFAGLKQCSDLLYVHRQSALIAHQMIHSTPLTSQLITIAWI